MPNSARVKASGAHLAVDDAEMRRLASAFSSAWADYEAADVRSVATTRDETAKIVEQLSNLRAGSVDALLDQASALRYFYAHHGDNPDVLALSRGKATDFVWPLEVRFLRAVTVGLYEVVRGRETAVAKSSSGGADRTLAGLHALHNTARAAEARAQVAVEAASGAEIADSEDLYTRLMRCTIAVAREMADIQADSLAGILCQVDVLRSIYAHDGPEPDLALDEDASVEGVVSCAIIRGLLALPFDPAAPSPTSGARASAA